MNKVIGCAALGLVLLTGGCALTPDVDKLPPMPAADPGSANPDPNTKLANGMDEPEPQNPESQAAGDSQNSPDQSGQPQQTPDQGLWSVIRDGYKLPEPADNQRVRIEREWYANHPEYFSRVSTRAERYLYFIVQQAKKRHMPLELALLPVVESAFDPFAYSHGRASGPWQFIPSTAHYFGLKENWWYDGRRDIVRSTDAALDYLQSLSQRFDGDWLLALAAYNAGGGTVAQAVRRNKERGEPTDFWHLDLPAETASYVPKLLAVAEIVKDPKQYGIQLHPIPDEPYFKQVKIGSQIDLSEAARLAGVSTEEMYLLNPAYNRWATAPNGPHTLLVPVDDADRFEQRLAQLPASDRVQWRRYKVHHGDTLIAIARDHRTTPAVLRDINHLNGNTIVAGHTLLIPSPASGKGTYTLSAAERLAQRQDRHRSGRHRVNYQVSAGDTLWDIAHQHRVTVRNLAKWNNMAPGDPLHVGQTLAIWRKNGGGSSTAADHQMIRKVRYSVRQGDSLYAIADRFNVSVSQIRNWNSSVSGSHYLQPGDDLTLYVDVRNAP